MSNEKRIKNLSYTNRKRTIYGYRKSAQITNRLNRAVLGNYGDCELVGEGVFELRIHYGPGYRVYFSEQRDAILLLLIGGSKRT